MESKVKSSIKLKFHSGIKTEKKYHNKLCRKRNNHPANYPRRDSKHVVSFKKAFVVLLSLPLMILMLPFMLLSELDSVLDDISRDGKGRIN